jgi:hypothetical protein
MEDTNVTDDPRCCGSGTCIIDPSGRCWCGQQWNGQSMSAPCEPAHEAKDAGNAEPELGQQNA